MLRWVFEGLNACSLELAHADWSIGCINQMELGTLLPGALRQEHGCRNMALRCAIATGHVHVVFIAMHKCGAQQRTDRRNRQIQPGVQDQEALPSFFLC